jgi:site-specific DNA recombinase
MIMIRVYLRVDMLDGMIYARKEQVMRTVVYCRYSTHKQDNGVSIANQLQRCQQYAQFKGLEVQQVLKDEAISGGTNKGRPAFMKLLVMVEQREIDVVLCYDLTRLSRDMLSLLAFERFCNEYDVSIHTAEGEVSTDSPEAFMSFCMRAFLGEMTRRQIKWNTKHAMQHLKKNGKVFNHEPYGWKRDGDKLLEDAKEQQVIKMVNDAYLQGSRLADIQKVLKRRGIKTRNGKPWSSNQVKRVINGYEQKQFRGSSDVGNAIKTFMEAVC